MEGNPLSVFILIPVIMVAAFCGDNTNYFIGRMLETKVYEKNYKLIKREYLDKTQRFYEKHGVRLIEPAYECQQERGEVSLMVTKHCIRFSLNLCPKQVKGIRPEPLILINGQEKLTLRFDCKPCEMHVVGRLRNRRSSPFGQ